MEESVLFVEKQLNYKFKNKSLINQALIKTKCKSNNKKKQTIKMVNSIPNKNEIINTELLEFLGDSVLNLVMINHLLKTENELTLKVINEKVREIVSNNSLKDFGVKKGLDTCLKKVFKEMETIHDPNISLKNVADMIESIIGALFLDLNSDFLAVSNLILNWFEISFNSIENKYICHTEDFSIMPSSHLFSSENCDEFINQNIDIKVTTLNKFMENKFLKNEKPLNNIYSKVKMNNKISKEHSSENFYELKNFKDKILIEKNENYESLNYEYAYEIENKTEKEINTTLLQKYLLLIENFNNSNLNVQNYRKFKFYINIFISKLWNLENEINQENLNLLFLKTSSLYYKLLLNDLEENDFHSKLLTNDISKEYESYFKSKYYSIENLYLYFDIIYYNDNEINNKEIINLIELNLENLKNITLELENKQVQLCLTFIHQLYYKIYLTTKDSTLENINLTIKEVNNIIKLSRINISTLHSILKYIRKFIGKFSNNLDLLLNFSNLILSLKGNNTELTFYDIVYNINLIFIVKTIRNIIKNDINLIKNEKIKIIFSNLLKLIEEHNSLELKKCHSLENKFKECHFYLTNQILNQIEVFIGKKSRIYKDFLIEFFDIYN